MPMVMNQFAGARGAGGATLSDFMLARVAIDPMRSQSVPIQDELLPFMLAQQGRNGGGMYSMPTGMVGFVPRMIPEDAPAEPKAYRCLPTFSSYRVQNIKTSHLQHDDLTLPLLTLLPSSHSLTSMSPWMVTSSLLN